MKSKVIGIYKITSPTGKIYIGQSTDITQRFKKYKRYGCKKQTKLYASLLKYGVDKHSFEIVCTCSFDMLDDMEKRFIDQYKCFNSDNGLNLKDGGSYGTHSDETRLKIGKAHKGKTVSDESRKKMSQSQRNRGSEISLIISKRNAGNKYAKGRTLSDEQKDRIREARKTQINPMFGKKHGPETIEKMRNAKLGKKVSANTAKKISIAKRGIKKSEEWKKRMSESMKGNTNRKSGIRKSIIDVH